MQRTDGGIFWWAVGITVLLGLAAFSWFFCISVFSHPEKPMHYELLSRFDKLEKIRRFSESDAPAGKAFTRTELRETFGNFSTDSLNEKSGELRRAYLTNYRDDRPVYVRGRFRIVHARPLQASDAFTSGVVARAVALADDGSEDRSVILEYILPTRKDPKAKFGPGDIIEIDASEAGPRRKLHAALLNVQRLPDASMVFTALPLVYGEHAVSSAADTRILAEPPARLNIKAAWPVTGRDPSVSTDAALTVAAP
jgi:hypothetical protein